MAQEPWRQEFLPVARILRSPSLACSLRVNLLGVFQGQQAKPTESATDMDHYGVLGVSRDAQPYQILTAYNNKLAEVRLSP